jgi:hypothetical protein
MCFTDFISVLRTMNILFRVFGGSRVGVGGQQEHYMYFRVSNPDRPVRTPVHIVLWLVSILWRNVEKQERQWRCNITLQRLRLTLFAVEKPERVTYSESVYSLIYLYYVVLCVLFGCVNFCVISERARFSESGYHKICVLIFSSSLVWNISHSEKNSVKYSHKRT